MASYRNRITATRVALTEYQKEINMENIEIEVPIQLLHASTICAAKKDVRFYLNGVAFSHGHITSCDGHRAMACPITGLDENVEFIIPTEAINFFLKKIPTKYRNFSCVITFDPKSKSGKISSHPHQAHELFMGIDGKYPDWRRIFPRALPPSHEFKGSIPQFNWQYLVDFQKVHKILGGNGINVGFRAQSANEVAGIFFSGSAFEDGGRFQEVKACLMPLRT